MYQLLQNVNFLQQILRVFFIYCCTVDKFNSPQLHAGLMHGLVHNAKRPYAMPQ